MFTSLIQLFEVTFVGINYQFFLTCEFPESQLEPNQNRLKIIHVMGACVKVEIQNFAIV